jgi:hypothetical protein
MTPTEIAERTISQLQDKRDRAAARVTEISAERQRLGYSAHVEGDEMAKARLKVLSSDLAAMSDEIETLDAAFIEARHRLDAARAAAGRVDANDRRAKARAILSELTACAPELDRTLPHPDDGVPYSPNNPPLCIRTATLTAALVVELKALNLYRGAPFPPHWHGAASIFDLEKALGNTVGAGWPRLSGEIRPATRTSIRFGVRQTVDFTRILKTWSAAIRNDLDRHEQTTKDQADAA